MLWHAINGLHRDKQLSKLVNGENFDVNLVKSVLLIALDQIGILFVAGDCDNLGLHACRNVSFQVHLPDCLGFCKSIRFKIVAVHDDEGVLVVFAGVKGLLDDFVGLGGRGRKLGFLLSLVEAKDHHEALDDTPVELFLVHNQHLADVKGLFGHFLLDKLKHVGRGFRLLFDFVIGVHRSLVANGSVDAHHRL